MAETNPTPAEIRAKVKKEQEETLITTKQEHEKAVEDKKKFEEEHPKPEDPRKSAKPTPLKGSISIFVEKGKGLLACDVGGTSDPFLVISMKDKNDKALESVKSQVVKKTLFPEFKFQHEFKVAEDCQATNLSVEVFDKDLIGKDFMGQIIFPLNATFWKEDCKHWDSTGVSTKPGATDHKLKARDPAKRKNYGSLSMYVVYESVEMGGKLLPHFDEVNEHATREHAVWKVEYDLRSKIKKLEEEIKYPAADSQLIDAVLDERVSKVKELLAEGADPSCQSKHTGTSVLQMAAERKNVEILLLMREAGADLDSIPFLYNYFAKNGPSLEQRNAWDADPQLKSMREEIERTAKLAREERAKKEMEEKKYKYCLVTGLTGYEDDFPHHLFEVKK